MNERQGRCIGLNLARLGLILALAAIALWAWPAAEAYADAPFATTYGETSSEHAYTIQQTADGGYVVAGYTWSFGAGDRDVWILKLNADGSIAWERTCGGMDADGAYAIQQTADGGYIVAGWTTSFGLSGWDAWVFKLDAGGGMVWQKTYGGEELDYAYAIQQTADGGYIVAGYTNSFGDEAWVLKLDADGNVVWQKTYGGANGDNAYAIQQTADGGYVVAGWTSSFGISLTDAWVLKLNADGSIAWQKTYDGGDLDFAHAVRQTEDGSYIVAGGTDALEAGIYNTWVLKLDADGNVAWQKTYGGANWDYANDIQQTADAGYVVAGETQSFGAGDVDVWALKLNADGSVAWQKAYGGMNLDDAYGIQQAADGGYVVTGSTESFGTGGYDVWVLKLEVDGSFCAGCALGEDTGVLPVDSNATVTDTTATPIDTTAVVSTSNATMADTNAILYPICVCFQPDLSVIKTVTPTIEVPYHDTVTYTVVLTNSTPASDTNVLLTDTLPVEVDFARWVAGGQPAGAEVVDDELTWQGTVAAKQAITFTFVVSHVGDYGDVVTNTARFSGTLQAGEDSATFTVVRLEPNLSITKAATPAFDVPYHGTVTYTVLLDNVGILSDTDVLLTDTLPAEVDFGHWVPGGQPAGAEVVDDELTWSGTVTAGQAIVFTFVVSHVGAYGDVVANTARFSGTLQAGEDSATFTVVGPEPGLFIAKTATPVAEVPYHSAVTYTVVLGNNGPASDTGVLLTDTLPTEVDFARWAPGGRPVGAEVVADEMTWSGTVTGGQALTFTFVISHVGAYGDVVANTARFSGTLQAGEDSATFTVADRVTHAAYLPLVLKNHPDFPPFSMTYGGTDRDSAHAIQRTVDDGYVVAGDTGTSGAPSQDVWVFKLDAEGGFCEGCSLGKDIDVLSADSNATVVDSDAIVEDSGAIVADSKVQRTFKVRCTCKIPPDVFGDPLQPSLQLFVKARIDLGLVGGPEYFRHVAGGHKQVQVRQLLLRQRAYLCISIQ